MEIFREALIALTPTADRLQLQWEDGRQHRDWERLAETLFDVCVRGPIESDSSRREQEFVLPRYDIDVASYADFSWISAVQDSPTAPMAFIRFMSVMNPFDAVQVAVLDPEALTAEDRVLLPLESVRINFVRRSESQADAVICEIEAVD